MRKAALEPYPSDLHEIVATLFLGNGENREQAIDFLKKRGAYNPLDEQRTNASPAQ